jgi:hypothetical protein
MEYNILKGVYLESRVRDIDLNNRIISEESKLLENKMNEAQRIIAEILKGNTDIE